MSLSDASLASALVELAPLLRRAVSLDPSTLVRVRTHGDRVGALVRLPFDVLAARTVRADIEVAALDATVGAAQLLATIDGDSADAPTPRDTDWRWAVPPAIGWARVETVPDSVVRDLVRTGALTLKDAAAREGVPGAQPRAEVADTLLDSVVLDVHDDGGRHVEVTLRVLSALTRLGFVPRGSHVAIDAAGRWSRVVAEYGTVYAERPGMGLSILR